ncbi:hypothetical protein Vafri_3378 [Volvox africanus]|uniref:Uncharacterized protein n=1 Tax=Volvox africanus TaxID=51714 RepID=A0A8J4AT57_9CHLO|nr:hypothetical protein Vafri_3378 [Volvox africanus]
MKKGEALPVYLARVQELHTDLLKVGEAQPQEVSPNMEEAMSAVDHGSHCSAGTADSPGIWRGGVLHPGWPRGLAHGAWRLEDLDVVPCDSLQGRTLEMPVNDNKCCTVGSYNIATWLYSTTGKPVHLKCQHTTTSVVQQV